MSTMHTTQEMTAERDLYLQHVAQLFKRVELWIASLEPRTSLSRSMTDLWEEQVGAYSVERITLERDGYRPIQLVPRGRWVLGAEGRVDMQSDLGTETFVYTREAVSIQIQYLTEGGQTLPTEGDKAQDDVAEGWRFVQNRQLGMLPPVDKQLFLQLMEVLGR